MKLNGWSFDGLKNLHNNRNNYNNSLSHEN